MINYISVKTKFLNDLKVKFLDHEILFIWNQWVVKEILQKTILDTILSQEFLINNVVARKINNLAKHLLNNQPIQYFFGYTYFKEYKINVNQNVLIPRPETEELVDLVLKYIDNNTYGSILDIGTGSGCIAIALKKSTNHKVFAIDYSNSILNTAFHNAKENNVDIKFSKLNILSSENINFSQKINYIVSNPPYVIDSEVPVDSIVRCEPANSIFVNNSNPIIFYESICVFSLMYLAPGGKIFFEINPKFTKELFAMIQKYGYNDIEIVKDFYNKNRFIVVSS